MRYDSSGPAVTEWDVIGPDDHHIKTFLQDHPGWTDEQVSAELTGRGRCAGLDDVGRVRRLLERRA